MKRKSILDLPREPLPEVITVELANDLWQAHILFPLAPDYPDIADILAMDGRERCVHNARMLEAYFNSEGADEDVQD